MVIQSCVDPEYILTAKIVIYLSNGNSIDFSQEFPSQPYVDLESKYLFDLFESKEGKYFIHIPEDGDRIQVEWDSIIGMSFIQIT